MLDVRRLTYLQGQDLQKSQTGQRIPVVKFHNANALGLAPETGNFVELGTNHLAMFGNRHHLAFILINHFAIN